MGWLTKPTKHGWASWWIYLWGLIMAALLTSLFFIPFVAWTVCAAVFFGSMETVGVVVGPPYPPLTEVIKAYIPDWVAFPAIYALLAGAGAKWMHWPNPWGIALLVGLLGWFTTHFSDTYKHGG